MDPNALMLWVHCNSCVRQIKDDPKLVMHFTNCGHFFCQHCVQNNTSPKCLVCGVQNVRTMVLGPNVSPDIMGMFQNSIKLPQMLHRAMEFQQGQIGQTMHLNRIKADKMTKAARSLMEECKMYTQKSQEFDEECAEKERKIHQIHEKRKQRKAANMNHQGHIGHSQSLSHPNSNMFGGGRPSHNDPTSNWTSERSQTPSFSDMEVNAFDPKTPDEFKMGKMMLSNSVTLQAMQQGPSPGHVRNLFSPKGQEDVGQPEQRRFSGGSSGGRGNTGLGLCPQRRSPFDIGKSPISRSPNVGVNRGYQ